MTGPAQLPSPMLRTLRIAILLFILASVALGVWRTRLASVEWKYTLPVNLYPVNGDGSEAVSAYLRGIGPQTFRPIEAFMQAEARRYALADRASIEVLLGPEIRSLPPELPASGNPLAAAWWSLRLRYWAWRNADPAGPGPQVRMFLVYFDPDRNAPLSHSTGLQKGLLGVVNVYADPVMAPENNVVIAHEFLHTLGATDKYDLATNLPRFPEGYAEPNRDPLHPQAYAEIMGARIPVTESSAVQPVSLNYAQIGPQTAREINWIGR